MKKMGRVGNRHEADCFLLPETCVRLEWAWSSSFWWSKARCHAEEVTLRVHIGRISRGTAFDSFDTHCASWDSGIVSGRYQEWRGGGKMSRSWFCHLVYIYCAPGSWGLYSSKQNRTQAIKGPPRRNVMARSLASVGGEDSQSLRSLSQGQGTGSEVWLWV